MSFNFEFSTKKVSTASTILPQVIIKNNKGRASLKTDGSYLFLNKAAVDLLEKHGKMPLVCVGIDIETQKICIVPAEDGIGRKLTRAKNGSAQISIDALIVENNLPTQTCNPRYYDTFALGGLLFDYKTAAQLNKLRSGTT